MSNASRLLVAALAAALVTGTAMAQNAPPPQAPPAQGTSAMPKASNAPSKCKTKPNGCPKRKKQKQKAAAGTTGAMPQPAPTHR